MTIRLKQLPKTQFPALGWLLGVSAEPGPHRLLRVSTERAPRVPARSHPSAGRCCSCERFSVYSQIQLVASSYQVKYSLGAFGDFCCKADCGMKYLDNPS